MPKIHWNEKILWKQDSYRIHVSLNANGWYEYELLVLMFLLVTFYNMQHPGKTKENLEVSTHFISHHLLSNI